jgi:hypothetical protein
MKSAENTDVGSTIAALLPDDFADSHPFPPGWGGSFGESSGEAEEIKKAASAIFGEFEEYVQNLPVCPICGERNEPEATFQCPECGRSGLCMKHKDAESDSCRHCALVAKKKREAAAQDRRERAAKRREEAEKERKRLELERKREERAKKAEEARLRAKEEAQLCEKEEKREVAAHVRRERVAKRCAEGEGARKREEAENKRKDETQRLDTLEIKPESEVLEQDEERSLRKQEAKANAIERYALQASQRIAQKNADDDVQRRVVCSWILRIGSILAVLGICWGILRRFDVVFAQTGKVWPWCWWHLRFVVGLGFLVNLFLILTWTVWKPGNGKSSISSETAEKAVESISNFAMLNVLAAFGMFFYAVWHLFGVLGFSFRVFGMVLFFLLEYFVIIVGCFNLMMVCGGLLWGHYEE